MDNTYSTTPQRKDIIEALWRLQKIIVDTLDFNQVVRQIVDGLLTELGYLKLGYRIVVLTLVNEEKGVLQRISLSSTPEAVRAQQASAVPFHEIEIPLNAVDNILIKTLAAKQPYVTTSWPEMFTPALTFEQATANQIAAGIKTSMIYPVIVHDKAIGVLIFSMVKEESEVMEEEKELIRGFTDIVGLAVQNSRLYSSLDRITNDLRAANDKLQQLDKLKDEFVSLASHELRTPMTVIKSYLWLLLEGKAGELNEKQKTYLDRTYLSTNRLIDMVNDMLNISRIESGRLTIDPKSMDVKALISEVVGEMQPKATELGVSLSFQSAENIPPVMADSDRIKQVLINLIGNSLKFTPKDGNVIVVLQQQEGNLLIQIKDTGMGIRPEDMEKLFKKFNMLGNGSFTKQSGQQGSGLGLYLSKGLIEMHKGRIWVESEGEGKGATFSFTLPIT